MRPHGGAFPFAVSSGLLRASLKTATGNAPSPFPEAKQGGRVTKERKNEEMDSSMQKLVETVRASRSKQAIALCGAANTGKTHVLKKLSNWFRDRDAIIIAMKDMGNGRDELWAFGYQDVCIGIATGGDNQELITAAFTFFAANACDIVYCSTRYRADSSSWTEFQKECSSRGFTIHWTSSMDIPEECHLAINQARAAQLAAML